MGLVGGAEHHPGGQEPAAGGELAGPVAAQVEMGGDPAGADLVGRPRPAMPEAATTYLSGKRSSTALTRRALSSGTSKASQTIWLSARRASRLPSVTRAVWMVTVTSGAAAARMSRRASVLGWPSWVAKYCCRWRLDSSTRSKSMRWSQPTPARARQRARLEPSPPSPHTATEAAEKRLAAPVRAGPPGPAGDPSGRGMRAN